MENTRARKWFLTINPQAECYDNVVDIIQAQEKCFYSFIVHTMDKNEDGTNKLRHFHLCLDYANARTFESIKKTFKGAHIERPISWTRANQYLTHKNDSNKFQYQVDSVISNDVERYKTIYNNEFITITRFDFNKLRDYYIEYSNGNTAISFIWWLCSVFSLDRLKIIKQEREINKYIDLMAMNDDNLIEDTTKALRETIL